MSALESILRTEQPEPSRKAWDAWDREMKRHLGWWSGLKFGGTDEIGNRVLVQWHWPHRMFASWRVYPTPPDKGFLRHVGATRAHGCLTIAWWLSGVIIAKSAPGARDVPTAFWELRAPAIHAADGEYAGGGRHGATAKEWPDVPPATNPYTSLGAFLRGFFG